jgi:hypothetical protein
MARVSCILNNPKRSERRRADALEKRLVMKTGACMQKINTTAIIVYFLSERALISMQCAKGPF